MSIMKDVKDLKTGFRYVQSVVNGSKLISSLHTYTVCRYDVDSKSSRLSDHVSTLGIYSRLFA